MHEVRLLLAALLALLSAPTARAQACVGFGSTLTPATWTAAPLLLGCAGAPQWPQWHLYTPAYRALTPRSGRRPGAVRELRALLVPYECTGLLLAPVRLRRVRTMGFVVDVAEESCR